MRIAVTFDTNGQVFQHFGHTEMLKIYDINDKNKVASTATRFALMYSFLVAGDRSARRFVVSLGCLPF